jgi:hypothetical protein
MIWRVVQYFFDARQKAKFEFLGTTEFFFFADFVATGTDYAPIIDKYVHPDYLPKIYGGNLDWDLPKAQATPEVRAMIPTPVKVPDQF